MHDIPFWFFAVTNVFSFVCGGLAFKPVHYKQAIDAINEKLAEHGLDVSYKRKK